MKTPVYRITNVVSLFLIPNQFRPIYEELNLQKINSLVVSSLSLILFMVK